jgi:ABC-type oligopeptide transport system ATPase subunit
MRGNPLFDADRVSKVFHLGTPFLPGLWRCPREVRALSTVSLQISEGEVFGIIGESGSGKSTLGFALADIERPTAGTIRFRGKLLDQMYRHERQRFRQKVQVVFQDSASALNPRRRVGAILRDSLRLRGMPRNQRSAAVAALLKSVGLSLDHAIRYPHQLSGGQRQRVGIARSLAMEPEVLIADEPVSALDVSVQAQIINLLIELHRKLNLTIVLISHDIAVVAHACDQIAVMRSGEIVETGPTLDVIHEPKHPYTRALIAAVPKGLANRPSIPNQEQTPSNPVTFVQSRPPEDRVTDEPQMRTPQSATSPARRSEGPW